MKGVDKIGDVASKLYEKIQGMYTNFVGEELEDELARYIDITTDCPQHERSLSFRFKESPSMGGTLREDGYKITDTMIVSTKGRKCVMADPLKYPIKEIVLKKKMAFEESGHSVYRRKNAFHKILNRVFDEATNNYLDTFDSGVYNRDNAPPAKAMIDYTYVFPDNGDFSVRLSGVEFE